MCKILCKLITLYNMKIRLWDCKTYGYGYIAACLQCYYSELSKLSSTPGQTIAAPRSVFIPTLQQKSGPGLHTTHVCIIFGLIPPCRPMLTTTSHSCHRYLLLQSLHAIFGALHSVQTIRSAAFLHSTTLPTWYLYQVSHYNSIVVGTWGTCLRACRCPRPPRPWARAAAARPSPPPPPCRHPAACSPPPARSIAAAWQDLRWILKILKVSSDKKKISFHITTSKARNQKHRWLLFLLSLSFICYREKQKVFIRSKEGYPWVNSKG